MVSSRKNLEEDGKNKTMELFEKINQDLVSAIKEKQTEKVSVLRMLVAALRNKEITLRKGGEAKLSDEQTIDVINSEIKKRRDSIESYKQADRKDLADKEKAELEILVVYMPVQLSDKELEKIVDEIISSIDEVTMKDFGKIMGQTMAKVKGKADGNKVGEVVKKILGSK